MPRAPAVLVVGHPAGEALAGVALVPEEEFVVVLDDSLAAATLLIDPDVVESGAVPLVHQMHFPHGIGLVAGVATGLGERCHRRQGLLRVVPATVGSRGEPGQQGAAGGDANRALAVGVGETHPVRGHLIQGRRHHHRMPRAPEQAPRPLVHGDQDDVGMVLFQGRGVFHGDGLGPKDWAGVYPPTTRERLGFQ